MSTVIPEIAQLDPRSVECKELLKRVINSRELKRASRLRELLEYIGTHAQNFPSHTIREQLIGAAVFGRPADYDTALDNIVRVNVSELRKRLIHYFSEEGLHETIAIEIPRGGYLPIFFPRSIDAVKKTPDPPVPLSPATETAASTSTFDLSANTIAATPPAARRHLAPLLIALVIAVFACGLLLWQNHRLAVQLQPWKTDALKDSFWADFFSSGDRVDIVTADTSFALAEDILGQKISLHDYLDYKYMSMMDQPGLPTGTKSALKHVLERNNGSIGDFQAAKRFMDLDGYSSALKLASARSYTTETIKADDVILIGARESNPWVDLYRDRMNFFLDYDPSTQHPFIVNSNPQPGEKAIYETGRDPDRSYSVVSFLPNLTDQRYVLIIAGVDSQATRAAGDFITSPEGLAQIRQRMPTGHFPYFELVLASSRLVGTTLHTEIIASRVNQR